VVADFDGDGQPEIAVAVYHQVLSQPVSAADPSRFVLHVYELDGTERWHRDLAPTGGAIRAPAPAAFDFDADGFPELVYQDAHHLYVLDGRDGSTRFRMGISSFATGLEINPVIADVDNDGGAEIVTYLSQYFATGAEPRSGILVIGDANDNWTHARRAWNQWSYHPASTNED